MALSGLERGEGFRCLGSGVLWANIGRLNKALLVYTGEYHDASEANRAIHQFEERLE